MILIIKIYNVTEIRNEYEMDINKSYNHATKSAQRINLRHDAYNARTCARY